LGDQKKDKSAGIAIGNQEGAKEKKKQNTESGNRYIRKCRKIRRGYRGVPCRQKEGKQRGGKKKKNPWRGGKKKPLLHASSLEKNLRAQMGGRGLPSTGKEKKRGLKKKKKTAEARKNGQKRMPTRGRGGNLVPDTKNR